MSLTAATVKAKAKALGADLVGIARGEVLDHHPPDPCPTADAESHHAR